MQALVKEGGGGDHVSVGVRLPNKKYERPIQNKDLFIGPNGKQKGELYFLWCLCIIKI